MTLDLVNRALEDAGLEPNDLDQVLLVGGSTRIPYIKNTAIPKSRSEDYTTVVDGQQEVEIRVYQGESPDVSENMLLGAFTLTGLPARARAGEPQIVVSIDYDLDGIVHVRAEEHKSKRKGSIVIEESRRKMTAAERESARASLQDLWDSRARESSLMP